MSANDRVTLVTGGGRGIGAATARLLAARGDAVAVNCSRHPAEAQQVVRQIVAAGGRAIAVQADVADAAAVAHMFERVAAELGPLTGLVNNAGITGPSGPLSAFDAAATRRVLEVNVIGTLLCAQQAAARMARSRGGRGGRGGAIVNVSSVSSQTGAGGMLVPYAASKGAVNSLSVGLARELAGEGIRVNAVMPGVIDTEIHAAAGLADRVPSLLALVPLRRMGTPEECAEAIAWLLSDASAYVTGTVLPVTGGR